MSSIAAYDELIRRSREQAVLASCSALLGWDEQTYMPTGGAENRGNQLALLAGMHHERATDPKIGGLLDEVEASPLAADPDSPEAANLREFRRSYRRQTRYQVGVGHVLFRHFHPQNRLRLFFPVCSFDHDILQCRMSSYLVLKHLTR